MDKFIPLSVPNFIGNEKKYVDEAVEAGWVSTGGKLITDFENKMKEYAKRIMSLAPIRMQQEAQDILSSYIYEIYQNGLFHSDSPIGVFTSGYWDRDKKEFTFSI